MSDLIERQAAIDAIRASTLKYTGFMEMEMYTDDDAVEAIEDLPSAQPEIIYCRDCIHAIKDRLCGGYWCKGNVVKGRHYCGYDWMIESIIRHSAIGTEREWAERRTDE